MTDIGERELPSGWRWAKLGNVCRIVNGTTPDTTKPEYWDGENVWITPADLGKLQGNRITTSARRITQEGYNSCGTELVPPGSVVLSSRAPIGHLAIADVPLCTNQGCKTLVPSENIVSSYLYFALKQAVPELQALGSGATFAEVSKAQVANFEIPLPPLPEQKRIAAILTEQLAAVDRARAAAEAQLQTINQLPAAYLRVAFSGTATPSSMDEAKILLLEKYFGIPSLADWRWVKLGDVAETRSGTTPSRGNAAYYAGSIPWVKTGELKDGMIYTTGEYVSEDAVQDTSLKLLPVETLLIAMYGQGQTRGRTGLLRVPATINQACFAILPNPEVFDTYYLQWWFRFSYDRLRSETEGRGGNQPNLNGDMLKHQRIPLPPISQQRYISYVLGRLLSSVDTASQKQAEQLDVINQLPATLLQKAFSGES